jgi:hypothetical protein
MHSLFMLWYNLSSNILCGSNDFILTYLTQALRISEGRYFINGNRRLSRDGKYNAAGSAFRYHSRRTHKCPGECILSKGPTTKPIDIMVFFFIKWCLNYKYQNENKNSFLKRSLLNNEISKSEKKPASNTECTAKILSAYSDTFFLYRKWWWGITKSIINKLPRIIRSNLN